MKPTANLAADSPGAEEFFFTDVGGTHWAISERDGSAVPGSRGSRYLVCMTDNAVRRIWDFPVEWRHLRRDDLQMLVDRPCCGMRSSRLPLTRAR
jgi:hypothetical protein